MSEVPPTPAVKAFLVCDTVIHDRQTNKMSLVGVFHDLASTRFPAVHPSLWLYANLTDAHGRYEFEVRLMDMRRSAVLGSGTHPPVDIPDPLLTREFSAQLRNVAFPGPGIYEFQLLANRQLLATKAIRVVQVDGQGRPVPEGASPPPAGPPSHGPPSHE
jgi:hypothetical protein